MGTVAPEISVYPKHIHSPADRFIDKALSMPPTQRPSNLTTGSVYDRLSKDIWEKYERNQLTPDTFCLKMCLWRYLFFFIKVSRARGTLLKVPRASRGVS